MFKTGDSAERKALFDVFWEVLSRCDPRFVTAACEYAGRGGCGKLAFLEPGDLYKAAGEFSALAARQARGYLPPPELPSLSEEELRRRHEIATAALREIRKSVVDAGSVFHRSIGR